MQQSICDFFVQYNFCTFCTNKLCNCVNEHAPPPEGPGVHSLQGSIKRSPAGVTKKIFSVFHFPCKTFYPSTYSKQTPAHCRANITHPIHPSTSRPRTRNRQTRRSPIIGTKNGNALGHARTRRRLVRWLRSRARRRLHPCCCLIEIPQNSVLPFSPHTPPRHHFSRLERSIKYKVYSMKSPPITRRNRTTHVRGRP